LLASVVFTFFYRKQSVRFHLSLLVFLMDILVYETAVIITAFFSIHNHFIANFNLIIYYTAMMWLLYELWKHLIGKRTRPLIIFGLSVTVFCIGWIVENLFVRELLFFNMYTPAVASFFSILVIIYLLNQLLFVKNTSIFRDPEGLILLGLLIRNFPPCVILIFFNFSSGYSEAFYSNILFLANLVATISTIFFLMAVLWLPERKKYTWPF